MNLYTQRKNDAFTATNDAIVRKSINAIMRKTNDAIMRKSVDAVMRESINGKLINKKVKPGDNRIAKIAINRKVPSHYISTHSTERAINEHLYSDRNREAPSYCNSLDSEERSGNDCLYNGVFTKNINGHRRKLLGSTQKREGAP